jgi:hypothetical protein
MAGLGIKRLDGFGAYYKQRSLIRQGNNEHSVISSKQLVETVVQKG